MSSNVPASAQHREMVSFALPMEPQEISPTPMIEIQTYFYGKHLW